MSETETVVTEETAASPETTVETPASSTGTPDASATPEVPAYQPNFKFKAYDKEHEIDEMFRPLIKDQATEKQIKALFEKAYGLDDMKPKYQRTRQEYETFRKEADPILSGVNNLTQMMNKGDWDNFFKTLQISDDILYKHVLNKINLKEMTPEQQQEYNRNVENRQYSMAMEQQAQMFREQFEGMAVQNRTFELNTVLEKPDVKAIATAFESQHGPGSFKTAVIEHGFSVWKSQGRDLNADQAVQDFTRYIAPFVQGMNQQVQTPQQTMQQSNGRPPVIPNIAGRSTSPVKQVPKSIADLKKMAAQLD